MVAFVVLGLCPPLAGQPSPSSEGDAGREAEDRVPAVASTLERAERLWEERAQGSRAGRAEAERSAALVAAWEEALSERPDDLEIAWRLLRAIWFHGEHALEDLEEKQRIFERGREVADDAFRVLARDLGRDDLEGLDVEERARVLDGHPQAAPLHYWAAVSWGLWGEAYGKLAAAREGVGDRIRDHALVAALLDPEMENGGGDRLLGRLHSEAPRIPFFTGWVSREEAVRRLRKALSIAPDDPFNRLYLGEALLDHFPGSAAEGRELVRSVAEGTPRPAHRVEDERLAALARERLRRE